MATTLSTLRGNVRYHIDEPSANYWVNAELNAYISNRQLDLWRRIYELKKDFFLQSFTLTLVINQSTYSPTLGGGVPTDFFRVSAIRTTLAGYTDITWKPTDPNSAGFLDGLRSDVTTAYPYVMMYAVRTNQQIWVSPLPQIALTANVDYIQQPTAVALDTDTFVIPDSFLDFIEYKATADALAKGPVGDPGYWNNLAEESWRRILLALDTPRQDQGPDVVAGFLEGLG